MKELAYWLLLLLCMSVYAACFVCLTGLLSRDAAPRHRAACILGCLGAVLAGGFLPWALSRGCPWYLSASLVVSYGLVFRLTGFVWWKRRLRRRRKALSAFWDAVDDDYFWRKGKKEDGAEPVATELEAAEALGTCRPAA